MQSIATIVMYTHFVSLMTCVVVAQENTRKFVTHSNVLYNNLNDERPSEASLNIQPKIVVDYHRRNATQYHGPAATNIVSTATPNTKQQSTTYAADQYIDYYRQSPPAHKKQQDTATISTKSTYTNNGSASELSSTDDTAVNIAPTILIGLSSVQRTVSVVIERIRSMWDYVWSYFSEPGTYIFLCLHKIYFDM